MHENPKHLVNCAMHEASDEQSDDLPYLCECADEHCFACVWLTVSDFEALSTAGAFVLASGHRPFVPDLESAVAA